MFVYGTDKCGENISAELGYEQSNLNPNTPLDVQIRNRCQDFPMWFSGLSEPICELLESDRQIKEEERYKKIDRFMKKDARG